MLRTTPIRLPPSHTIPHNFLSPLYIRPYARLTNRNHNPSFQYFILRAQAIKLYRSFLRYTRRTLPYDDYTDEALDKEVRKELMEQVRWEFERRRGVKDLEKLRFYLAQGQKDFHKLQTSVDLSTAAREEKLRKEGLKKEGR